jgi:hypothetical protein
MPPPALPSLGDHLLARLLGRYGGEADLDGQLMSPPGSDPAGMYVPGRGPDDRAGAGRQRVHRVILRGHAGPPREHEGVAVVGPPKVG